MKLDASSIKTFKFDLKREDKKKQPSALIWQILSQILCKYILWNISALFIHSLT